MIRPETGKDITDEEFIKVLKPFVDNYDEYLESYILPEVISYYIANAYYRNECMKQHGFKNLILLEIY